MEWKSIILKVALNLATGGECNSLINKSQLFHDVTRPDRRQEARSRERRGGGVIGVV